MCKLLATLTATLAILSFGSLLPDRAQAGSSTSAASKYGHSANDANPNQVRNRRPTNDPTITEFSSSSAKVSVPKR
jgi:hypothetical protein